MILRLLFTTDILFSFAVLNYEYRGKLCIAFEYLNEMLRVYILLLLDFRVFGFLGEVSGNEIICLKSF